jgi:adenylyltransferase/sulfurtransferase
MTFSERNSRQINLTGFGPAAQEKLQQAKVLVVGAGGLGVPVLQYLAAMGVGTIGIVDGDTISVSNLNRQVLYTEAEVGLPKAAVAAGKLRQQNSTITLLPYEVFLHTKNALEIMQAFDLVIDGSDNFSTRYLINDACVMLGKPFVYGAIQQYEGHVSVFNLENGPTYRCLYPDFPSAGEIPDCNTAGVLGVVPGIIGCQQALEAVKVITGIGKTASGYLRIFDFLNNDQYDVKLKANPENKQISQLKDSYDMPDCALIPSLQVGDLHQWLAAEKDFLLIDVREQDEYERAHLDKSLLLPLSSFEAKQLPVTTKAVVTICQKGGRSVQAATVLRETYSNLEVYSLAGGMDQWLEQMGTKMVIS